MDEKLLKELIEIFRGEFGEQTQAMTDCLLELEKSPQGPKSKEHIDTIFRAAHNIKGSAKSLEFDDMGDIAHRLEDIFMALRENGMVIDTMICGLCFEAIDAMSHILQAHVDKTTPNDFTDLLARLLQASKDEEAIPTSDAANNVEKTTPAPKEEVKSVGDNVEKTTSVSKKEPVPVTESVTDNVEQVSSIRVSVDKLIEVGAISDELVGVKIKNGDISYQLKQLEPRINEINLTWEAIVDGIKKEKLGLPDVDLQLLYTSLADKDAILKSDISEILYNMRSVNAEFGLTLDSLNENARILRLMPVSTLLRPLLRTVRDISHAMNKSVEMEITGEEVELDRAILEQIKSPVIHLLRNAIDHGLESREERVRSNKPETGKILINVTEEGSEIHIVIKDDGCGIDLNKTKDIAIGKNLITPDEAEKLSPDAILDLLFLPGFSTKDIITDISGRGVGLDVVRTNIQSVKGRINIETKEGVGTTITMCFPLTIATDRGILVRVSNQLFIIPTQAVTRILNLESAGTKAIEGSMTIMLEGQPIPLFYMGTVIGVSNREGSQETAAKLALVISKGRSMLGFIIDEIIGEREIALKALMKPLNKTKYITGATLGGRGEVVLVLNPSDLIEAALKSSTSQLQAGSKKASSITPNILLAEDSITTRTLEESILKNKGYTVTSVVNGAEAWEALQKESFDLIVTDVEMPVMGGFELTEKVKKDKTLKEIPVVIVTSCASDEDKKKGVKAGANAYITKGKFEASALLKVVEQLL
jgi:two-component system chemotaxis sensor kinase CheA